ncbi:MAG: hypothetical protein RIQ60_756 [Pseudomonadota bacterium]|jgi:hypothetical protein
MRVRLILPATIWLVAGLLSGCDMLGMESGTAVAARKEAEGKAIGSACRHALRAIEDCYTLNPKSQKASVFAGWREMDEYMRDNKIEGIVPVVPRKTATPASAPTEGDAVTANTDAPSRVDAQTREAAAPRLAPNRQKSTH